MPGTPARMGAAPVAPSPEPSRATAALSPGASSTPTSITSPPGAITLQEFLLRTLGRDTTRPYLLMPGLGGQVITLIGELAAASQVDRENLVRLVLRNLGLELTEAGGAWVIQPQRAGESAEDELETWIYSPRHRPIHSLVPYFRNFPRLHFTHSGPMRAGESSGVGLPGQTPGLMGYPAAANGVHLGGTPAWPAGDATWNTGSTAPGPSPSTAGMGINGGGGANGAFGASGAYGAYGGFGGSGYGGATFGPLAYGAAPWPGGSAYNTQPFSGSATAISDPSLLVVRGHPRDIELLKSFMSQVDVPVPEVQLRVYVLEVRDQDSRNSAVQLLLNLLSGQLTAQAGSPSTETNRLFLGGRDISMTISRLTSDSRVRLVSSPTLRAADGSTASVTIGTDTPTLGSIVTFSGSVQQSVAYQSAGVLLNVSPHILNDSIRLMIWQELSSFAKTETGLSGTPTKLRRAFRTDVVARSGEVLMLGGLSESSQIDNRERGLLGLGSRSSESTRSEIVVLLQVLRI